MNFIIMVNDVNDIAIVSDSNEYDWIIIKNGDGMWLSGRYIVEGFDIVE